MGKTSWAWVRLASRAPLKVGTAPPGILLGDRFFVQMALWGALFFRDLGGDERAAFLGSGRRGRGSVWANGQGPPGRQGLGLRLAGASSLSFGSARVSLGARVGGPFPVARGPFGGAPDRRQAGGGDWGVGGPLATVRLGGLLPAPGPSRLVGGRKGIVLPSYNVTTGWVRKKEGSFSSGD